MSKCKTFRLDLSSWDSDTHDPDSDVSGVNGASMGRTCVVCLIKDIPK